LQGDVAGIADGVHARDPNARFGIASYADPEDNAGEAGADSDARFDMEIPPGQQPTDDQLGQALHSLYLSPLGDGLDPPKDWINGLDQLATTTAFRPRTNRIVVLLGDSSSHDPNPPDGGDPAHPTLADAIANLTAAGIRVVGVPITGYGDGLDGQGQASRLIQATGGTLVSPVNDPGDLGRLGGEIADGIANLPPVFETVTVTPVVTHCDTGLSVTFDPSGDETVAGGADATFAEHVRVDAGAPIGATLGCTVEYRINGEPTVRAGYTETVAVHVRAPALPVVVVGSVTTDATSANGAVITYSATAADAAGNPLTPVCTPASGSTFPVGVTVVSCTATDSAGNTATETATMTVFPANPAVPSIWAVRLLSPPGGGQLTITDQADVSVLFGAPCAGGPDAAPDWSPDGRSFAFAHGGGQRAEICVADVAGTNARSVATPTDALAAATFSDPAWSPDNALIAFAVVAGESASAIWTVPAAGGVPQALITTPGGAAQPAFQRQPDLVVTAAANPSTVPFGTRTTLRFTVDNHGSVTASNTRLLLSLPTGLRPEQVSTDTGTCAPATLVCALGPLAPGRTAVVRVVVTGVEPGPQVVRATAISDLLTANPSEAVVTITVTVGPRTGHLSLLTGVTPSPAYVGGDDIVVSYTVSNAGTAVMTSVRLATTLPTALGVPKSVSPAGCRADGTGCDLGSLQPGQTVEVRYVLAAVVAVNGTETATVTTTGPDTSTQDHTASAPVVVGQPALTVDPTIGPQGFVVHATGSGFPPGATVLLTWSPGISQTLDQVTVAANGTIDTPVLIFHHDQVGPRVLVAAPVNGTRFGQVSSPSFLVVPEGIEPPLFNSPN
ncbi:MAG TPA: HYR domain-containing protein, partial [Pseudonocardiaceae bacterium]|nr:HYR domain-containing protein [Pseudonocardiaceae bacterium]